jgi:nitric oxide reductase NorQ protein
MVKQYKPIVTFSYSRRVKKLKPGKTQMMRFKGSRVKVYVEPDGRRLKVIEAPKKVVPDLRKAETLRVVDGRLQVVYKKPDVQPKPKPKPTPPPEPASRPVEEPSPEPKPVPEPELPALEPSEPPKPEPKPPKKVGKPSVLSEAERKKAMLVPVPDSGPIPTPYIDWNNIPEHCRISGIVYHDYPISGAPKGMVKELREMFRRSRRYQNTAPVNILIQGPKGTGKSELIKKFAEDSGLPYWSVIGQEGIRADELLGHYELKEGTSKWADGVIPRAARAGGILHIDEANVIEPAILMRLDELLDNKRQLNMEDPNELIKAHPDLFVVFTMNPPMYEGVKPLPEPVMNRLTKAYYMDYPPPHIEMNILEAKLRKMGVKSSEFQAPDGPYKPVKGTMSKDVLDLIQIVSGLRKDMELSYTPSIRETQGFVQDLREGDDFFTAFDRNIKSRYYTPDEQQKVEEAMNAVRRRT